MPIRDEHKFDQQQKYQNIEEKENKRNDDKNILTENGYKSCSKSSLLSLSSSDDSKKDKILSFKQTAPEPEDGYLSNLRVLYTLNGGNNKKTNSNSKNIRYIWTTAERVLDAPDLMDDYYLNLLDWTWSMFILFGIRVMDKLNYLKIMVIMEVIHIFVQ